MQEFDIRDTELETAFDEITQLASESCGTPVATVSFLEADRQWFKSEIGLGIDQTSLDDSICAKTIILSKLVIINDLSDDKRFRNNPFVTGQPHLRFYAGARLETSDGLLLGAVCVGDFKPRPHGLTEAQASTLLALARAVMRELELRRSNKALAENTALLNGTLENVDQGILMVDQSGDVVVCNQRAIDLLGLPSEMMRSVPKFEEVKQWQIEQGEFAESDPLLVQAIRHEGNNIEASVYERRRPNGIVLEVQTNRLPNGGVVRTFADITARKSAEDDRNIAEERLRESEQRYRMAAHATSDAIYDWDFQTDRLQWGESLHGIFGYAHARAPATGTSWLENVHPGDRKAVEDEIHDFVAGQTGERWEGVYRWRIGNGDYAYVRDRAHLVRDQSGNPVRMVGALQDLTQARRAGEAVRTSEERLRLALAATGLGIWDLDFASGHREWSSEVHRILGVPETAALERDDFLPLVHPDDRARIDAAFYPAFDAGIPSVSATFRILRATDGRPGGSRWAGERSSMPRNGLSECWVRSRTSPRAAWPKTQCELAESVCVLRSTQATWSPGTSISRRHTSIVRITLMHCSGSVRAPHPNSSSAFIQTIDTRSRCSGALLSQTELTQLKSATALQMTARSGSQSGQSGKARSASSE